MVGTGDQPHNKTESTDDDDGDVDAASITDISAVSNDVTVDFDGEPSNKCLYCNDLDVVGGWNQEDIALQFSSVDVIFLRFSTLYGGLL